MSNYHTNHNLLSAIQLTTLTTTKLNYMAQIRERTISTELPLLVGKLSANFCG
jgi:hypothetical protein